MLLYCDQRALSDPIQVLSKITTLHLFSLSVLCSSRQVARRCVEKEIKMKRGDALPSLKRTPSDNRMRAGTELIQVLERYKT